MHTTLSSRPPALRRTRTSSAQRTPRVRKPPVVGARIAGHRDEYDSPFTTIYYGASSDFGKLNGACWYRLRGESRYSPNGFWGITSEICGRNVHLDAVVDDFGDLVVVASR